MQNDDIVPGGAGNEVLAAEAGFQAAEAKAPSIAKSTAKMSVATTVSQVTGFLRSMALAYALGRGFLNDTFSAANVMPNMIFELVMGGIMGSVIVPVYVQYLSEKLDDEARHMISNLANIVLLLALVLSVIGSIFSPFFVHLMTIRKPAMNTPVMVMFFRVFAFQIMFYAMAGIFSGVLNSHRKFTMPMAAPILNNIVVIATVLGLFLPYDKTNHELALLLLAIGTTVGVVVMALVQIPTVIKAGLKPRLTLDFKHPAVKQIAILGLPMLGFAITVQLNTYIIYMLLLSYDGGAMAYQNALAFFRLPYAIFAVSIATAIFPELSRFGNANDLPSFKKTLSLGLRTTTFIVIPSAVYMAIMAKPIIGLTLQHGRFDSVGTDITAAMLTSFSVALLSFSLYNMLTRVYYSLQDTKTPMIIGAVSVPLQIAASFLLIGKFNMTALPLAYALALSFGVVIQLYILRRKIGSIGASIIFRAIGKQVAAAAMAGLVIFAAYYAIQSLGLPRMLGLALEIAVAGVAGGIAYLGLALLLGIEEVDFIKRLSRRFLRAKVTQA
ncbi:MAG: murein biosynthesis integral membrane protein MurJ [Candidatus Aquicultor sp.]